MVLFVGYVLGTPHLPDRFTLTVGHLLEGIPTLEGLTP